MKETRNNQHNIIYELNWNLIILISMKNREIGNKEKFETIIPTKKCQNQLPLFNSSFKANESNSRIKQNQIGLIKSAGVVYFFSENQIYFMNNSNLQLILKEIELKADAFFIISFEEKIGKVFINSNEDQLIVVHYRLNNTLIQLFSLEDLILKQLTASKQSIVINKHCQDIQITLIDSFLFLDGENSLAIYSDIGEMQYVFPIKCSLFYYDDSEDITITLLDKAITIYNKQKESICTDHLTRYADNIIDFTVLSLYYTNRFIICYLSEEKESSDDMLIFLELDKVNKISQSFVKTEFFFIEDKVKTRASVFYYGLHVSPTILYAINKQAMKLSTFFIFEKKGDKDDGGYLLLNFDAEDDQIITNCPDDEGQLNYFIGLEVIDFKFKGYNSAKEIIASNEYDTPLLGLVLDTRGRLRVYYLRDSRPGAKLREVNENELFNKDLHKIKDKQIFDKSNTIVKTSIKSNIKDNNKSKSIEGIDIDQIQSKGYNDKLNALRNNFIHKLQFELDIKKEIIFDQFNISSLDKEIKEIERKMKDSTDYTKLISSLAKQSKEYLNKRGDINKTLIESRELIDKTKEELELLSKKKKEIDAIEPASSLLSQGIESTSLQTIISSPIFQSFYGKNESMTLLRELLSIEQKCISYSKQLEYNKELALINQEFQNKLKDINKKVSVYNKKLLYFNKLTDTSDKKTFIETNQNEIFMTYIKEFDYYLFELKKVFSALKKDIEENKVKGKDNQLVAHFGSDKRDNNVYQSQFSIEKRIRKQMTDYSQELAKILLNTPCSITYVNEEGCKTIEEIFFLNDNSTIAEDNMKKIQIEKQKNEDIIKSINSLEEMMNQIQLEKIKMKKTTEEEIKKEEEKLLIAKQTEEKYNALNKKIIEYEKEREENIKMQNEKKETQKREIEKKEEEKKQKEERDRKERERAKEEENRQKKKSKNFKKDINEIDIKDIPQKHSNKRYNDTFSDDNKKRKDNLTSKIVTNESINISNAEENKKNNDNIILNITKQKEQEKKPIEIKISQPEQKNTNKEEKKQIFISNEVNTSKVVDSNQKTHSSTIIEPNTNPKTTNESNPFQINKNATNWVPNKNYNLFSSQNNTNLEKKEENTIFKSPQNTTMSNLANIPIANSFSNFSIPQTTTISAIPAYGQSPSLGNNMLMSNSTGIPLFGSNLGQGVNNTKKSGFSNFSTVKPDFFGNNNANNNNQTNVDKTDYFAK